MIIALVLLMPASILAAELKVTPLGNNNVGSVEHFKKQLELAEHGNSDAQLYVGTVYYEGHGIVPISYEESFKWTLKAAEQGNSNAQFLVSTMYEKEEGIEKNYKESFLWALKAAEQGNLYVQPALAMKYYKGEGVTQNYVEAYKWISLASINGQKEYVGMRNLIESKMTKEQIAASQQKASEWQAKHPDPENN